MAKTPERNSIFSALVAATLLGCTDTASPPQALVPPTRPTSIGSTINGSQITVIDEQGTAFTFDPIAQELRDSYGTVVELPSEELAVAANAFASILAGDAMANQIESAPPPEAQPPGEGNGGPCGGVPCIESAPLPGTSTPVVSLFNLKEVSKKSYSSATARFGVELIPTKNTGRSRNGAEPGNLTINDWPPSCTEISSAIIGYLPDYNYTRHTFLNTVQQILTKAGGLGYRLYNYQWALAIGGSLVGAFELSSVNTTYSYTKMNVLVGMYQGFGCQNVYPGYVGSIWLGRNLNLKCHTETWEVSTNGGNTWTSRVVSVCKFEIA